MIKKIIGVDIDGVITDESHPNDNIWHHELCQYLGQNIKRIKDSYHLDQAYDLPLGLINAFLEQELTNIYHKVRPLTGAIETLQELAEQGFKVILITARHDEHRSITEEWLHRHQIPYSALLHDDDKAPRAVQRNIKLFIEDNAHNAEQISEKNIPVLLMNKYHNKYLSENEKIIRVDTWSKIREFILSYFKLKQSRSAG